MNRKVGLIGAGIIIAGVITFAVCMLAGPLELCYGSSIAIAWGLILALCAFYESAKPDTKTAAMCGVAFGVMYALCNTVVYFIQLTTVKQAALSAEATSLLDYRSFGLMFSLDLLGYCLMALSTFFAGLTVVVKDRGDRALKVLLLLHGVFAITCFILPLLGIFTPDLQGADWIGTAIMEFWCAFFLPIGILSFRYFKKQT